ncbi:enoyl-CoA hydratase/isomerase family protein [Nioella sediminis]|jgi:enoyl-CoA hydratase|uniref:enoyl-CoA hydratase/isomerase family protein n=1 Tax=Nioella sediminis TaxID=1912092 RepID=UPI0008FD726C|nr:enoyl-CoA hydratase/isomerase family protein [Nioella sediminis]TBX28043.1 enoyl-CoA hydratase [Roseovarius sp. JS7-11]
MSDITCRIEGRASRITLDRPKALNALTWDMCLEIERALTAWADDPVVKLLIIDGLPCEKAFCAGGDLAEMYATGSAGDYSYGRRFWQDEYRMNAALFNFPKPVVTFLHGFVMGGGVGVGCHGSHRIVCDDSRIAMPETKVGLVPDVGGSLILARAPGRLGEYLGVTSARMGPGDAIHAGFADYYIPREHWASLIDTLVETGDWEAVDRSALSVPDSKIAAQQVDIDSLFGGETLRDIVNLLQVTDSDLAKSALKAMDGNSPISMACAVELIHRSRAKDTIEGALDLEYRFTARSMEKGDFLEGIRALIIDKDNAPKWRHAGPGAVPPAEVSAMFRPLGADALTL